MKLNTNIQRNLGTALSAASLLCVRSASNTSANETGDYCPVLYNAFALFAER